MPTRWRPAHAGFITAFAVRNRHATHLQGPRKVAHCVTGRKHAKPQPQLSPILEILVGRWAAKRSNRSLLLCLTRPSPGRRHCLCSRAPRAAEAGRAFGRFLAPLLGRRSHYLASTRQGLSHWQCRQNPLGAAIHCRMPPRTRGRTEPGTRSCGGTRTHRHCAV